LTSTQEKIVLRWLSERPMNLGYPTELWTGPRVAHLIEQEFGVRLHPHYVVQWLRERGYTPQVPARVPIERDQATIAQWVAHRWPRIQRHAVKTGCRIAFIDESGVLMAPLVRRSWAPRGHQPTQYQRGRGTHEKVSIAAAIWLDLSRADIGLFFKTLPDEYFDSYYSACFLEALLKSIEGTIITIWDGGNMHRGDPIRAIEAAYPNRIAFERLPPYAPTLNPVELLWNWLKYDRLSNFAPENSKELDRAVIRELNAIRSNRSLLTSFFEGSDLSIPRALLS
jgi:transposase